MLKKLDETACHGLMFFPVDWASGDRHFLYFKWYLNMNYGIIVAAGKSERMGVDADKAFLSLGSKPILAYSILAFEKCPDIDGVVLVVRKDKLNAARGMVQMFGCMKVKKIVAGGSLRQNSVKNGFDYISSDAKIVSIHDGARPCITPGLISETIRSAQHYGSGVAAIKITDTIKQADKGMIISKTLDRSKLWAVQTPQSFKRELLEKAFAVIEKKRLTVTDEAAAVELISKGVRLVQASLSNIKVTTVDDIAIAAALLKL